ncbi:hypothetical protein [Caenispirillum salinarum]|uniref:hypothetical protein n=1 Tax=Caenispirillum salinarum TaxID=859058 RepID=UPI00385179A1
MGFAVKSSPEFVYRKNSIRLLATLGPEGTSSENTAKYVSQIERSDIRLFPTYEEAARFVTDSSHAALLVANAYQRINEFYISDRFSPLSAFFYDTPPYALASRDGVALEVDRPRIATHQAPSHLVRQLLATERFDLVYADSTSAAAAMAASGEVDACLTTQKAQDRHGLIRISDQVVIPMLWTLFVKK